MDFCWPEETRRGLRKNIGCMQKPSWCIRFPQGNLRTPYYGFSQDLRRKPEPVPRTEALSSHSPRHAQRNAERSDVCVCRCVCVPSEPLSQRLRKSLGMQESVCVCVFEVVCPTLLATRVYIYIYIYIYTHIYIRVLIYVFMYYGYYWLLLSPSSLLLLLHRACCFLSLLSSHKLVEHVRDVFHSEWKWLASFRGEPLV